MSQLRTLEFTILTALRTGEAINACSGKIAGDARTIPPDRTMIGKEHRVPLSRRHWPCSIR